MSSSSPHHHLYNTARWKKIRARHLGKHPLCKYCEQQGRVTAAAIVDHVKPHRGDEALFFDEGNLQSLCKLHHDSTKQAEESGGVMKGAGLDGQPLDPNHPWNTGGG